MNIHTPRSTHLVPNFPAGWRGKLIVNEEFQNNKQYEKQPCNRHSEKF